MWQTDTEDASGVFRISGRYYQSVQLDETIRSCTKCEIRCRIPHINLIGISNLNIADFEVFFSCKMYIIFSIF